MNLLNKGDVDLVFEKKFGVESFLENIDTSNVYILIRTIYIYILYEFKIGVNIV